MKNMQGDSNVYLYSHNELNTPPHWAQSNSMLRSAIKSYMQNYSWPASQIKNVTLREAQIELDKGRNAVPVYSTQ